MAFLARKELLELLYTSLPNRQSRVLLGKGVLRVDLGSHNRVRVFTHDGDSYEGNLVIGADGIHSKVRAEMWRIANTVQPGVVGDLEMKSGR